MEIEMRSAFDLPQPSCFSVEPDRDQSHLLSIANVKTDLQF
jgi:hypothetical protein